MTAPRHRLSSVERLARDICWAEFADPRHAGCSKAAYWLDVHPNRKAEYIEDAEWFTMIVRKLGAPTIAKILAETI